MAGGSAPARRGEARRGSESGRGSEAGRGGEGLDAPQRRPRRVRVLLAVASAALLADVISKTIVVSTLSGHTPVRLLGGLLTLQVLRNSGAAFNIGTSMTVLFTLIAAGVVVFILRTARKLRSLPWAVTLGLLLGGATGNLIDRLARSPGPLRGYVVDWIQLPHWPVFNLADSAIVCGGALAILLSARGFRIDGTREGAGDETPDPGAPAPVRAPESGVGDSGVRQP
jgi:lipoprotein signal peptidase